MLTLLITYNLSIFLLLLFVNISRRLAQISCLIILMFNLFILIDISFFDLTVIKSIDFSIDEYLMIHIQENFKYINTLFEYNIVSIIFSILVNVLSILSLLVN